MHGVFLSDLWVKFGNGLGVLIKIYISLKHYSIKPNSQWVLSAPAKEDQRLLQDRTTCPGKALGEN